MLVRKEGMEDERKAAREEGLLSLRSSMGLGGQVRALYPQKKPPFPDAATPAQILLVKYR